MKRITLLLLLFLPLALFAVGGIEPANAKSDTLTTQPIAIVHLLEKAQTIEVRGGRSAGGHTLWAVIPTIKCSKSATGY